MSFTVPLITPKLADDQWFQTCSYGLGNLHEDEKKHYENECALVLKGHQVKPIGAQDNLSNNESDNAYSEEEEEEGYDDESDEVDQLNQEYHASDDMLDSSNEIESDGGFNISNGSEDNGWYGRSSDDEFERATRDY